MQSIDSLPERQLAPGLVGRYLHGKQMTIGWVEIEAGARLGLHAHPHEQTTVILEGELEMEIGGEIMVLSAGMTHVIPGGTPHSAHAHTYCRLMDVFCPVREDYR